MEKAPPAATMDFGPLIHGIPALGPNDNRKIAWGQFAGLHKYLGDKAVTVVTKYKYRGINMPPVTSALEVRSFAGVDAVDPDGTRQSAKELKRIADALDKAGSGFRPLHVMAETSEEDEPTS